MTTVSPAGRRNSTLAPENLLLYKLSYFSLSQQQKHTPDIRAMLLAQPARLDQACVAG